MTEVGSIGSEKVILTVRPTNVVPVIFGGVMSAITNLSATVAATSAPPLCERIGPPTTSE
jgi:hypothetical protein